MLKHSAENNVQSKSNWWWLKVCPGSYRGGSGRGTLASAELPECCWESSWWKAMQTDPGYQKLSVNVGEEDELMSVSSRHDPGCQVEPQGTSQRIQMLSLSGKKSKPFVELLLSVASHQTSELFLLHSVVNFAIWFCWEKLTWVGQGLTLPDVVMWSNTKSSAAEAHIWSYIYFPQRKKLLSITWWYPSCSSSLFSNSRAWSREKSRGWGLNPAGIQRAKPWYCRWQKRGGKALFSISGLVASGLVLLTVLL